MIAKERSAPYLPGERRGMVKVKRTRTIDAVVAGWRPGKEERTVGALILGLYDGEDLRVVGHCSGLTAKAKRELRRLRSPPMRQASVARPTPAAGAPGATSSGLRCVPSSS